MDIIDYNPSQISYSSFYPNSVKPEQKSQNNPNQRGKYFSGPQLNILLLLKNWIDNIEVNNSSLAHLICKLIPTQCPFQRQIKMFGRTILSIPPLCKLNPIYDQLMFLRFRAISYLADICGEDVSNYC